MRTEDYILERLKDEDFARGYIEEALDEDFDYFLHAMKNVLRAHDEEDREDIR